MFRRGRTDLPGKAKTVSRVFLCLAALIPLRAYAQSAHDHHRPAPVAEHVASATPIQPGQAAFAAIQEIVEILEADRATDWSKVNIEALRQHLIDMDNVTLHAEIRTEALDTGMRFNVTGDGPVRNSLRRMIMAHAATMNGVDNWRFEASEIEGGASLAVRVPAGDVAKPRGLGFLGVMTHGMHHQMHHIMIARGEAPHH